MTEPLTLIVNPHAGGGRARRSLPAVQASLRVGGAECETHFTENLGHAGELARGAAAAGRVAVAFGGDGLIGAVAGALRGTEGTLGVLPGGRGNDFARVLGLPAEPEAAAAILLAGVPRPVDLGETAEGAAFVGIASCGFDSDANRIANQATLVRGNLVYAYGALRALAAWKPASFVVTIDDAPARRFTGYSVAAANSKAYGGGMLLAPDASLEDGLLDVVISSHIGKLRFLALLPTVFRGEHVNQPQVTVLRGRQVTISADRPFTVYADGDPIAELPATIRAVPHAIRVLLPAP
ncbi:MAG TPA: diacylglycerol kinase family protein [Solirubrobacteraceae bacterium]|nr:diacylglycerol kinase family protein [Solirubrobacteraceae bacterium]